MRFTVVPHTHWDREWYLPFQVFRMRLARVIDGILDVLETDPSFSHFALDGQAVVLEDYLELRPEAEARLRAALVSGRLAVGPSYVLPDEFLSSQEALVRNLLHGRRVSERFGARPMSVGYMPDPFGHVAQFPQILAGFGLDALIFWRGLGSEADQLGAFFRWRAPDGTSVLAIRQLGSYANCDELGRWPGDGKPGVHASPELWAGVAADRFPRFLRQFGDVLARSVAPEALLCNGSDHRGIQPDLPTLIEGARARHPGLQVRIAGFADFVETVRPHWAHLPVHEGELRHGREAPILRGIDSIRVELKQAAERTERELLTAEVLASLAVLRRGVAYPADELRLGWRELLRNLPHDSISGCSIDEVHLDMQARFTSAGQIADRIRREALAALAGQAEPWTFAPEPSAAMSVVNILPWKRSGVVDVPLPEELMGSFDLATEGESGRTPVQRLTGEGGRRIGRSWAQMSGFSGSTFRLVPGQGQLPRAVTPASAIDSGTLENGMYRVTLQPWGEISVEDLANGVRRPGLNRFEDAADRGDEYTFCPLEVEPAWSSKGLPGDLQVVSRGPITATIEARFVARLPAALAPQRSSRAPELVDCPMVVEVSLTAGVERVDIRTTVDNAARDHRLRVHFPAPTGDRDARAEGHFAVLLREVHDGGDFSGWAEAPSGTDHTTGFVAAGNVVVYGRGLPEYEILGGREGGLDIALTLMRCVGWLSRDDLPTRPGHAGPPIETPGAQGLGRRTFEYALSLRGTDSSAELLRASAEFGHPLVVGPPGGDFDAPLLLNGDPVGFAALKGAEDGEGVICRLYAVGSEPASVDVSAPGAEVIPCRLDETAPAEAPAHLRWQETLPPGRIATLRVRPTQRQ